MIDDIQLQAVEDEGSFDDTFLTCNAPTADMTADRTALQMDITSATLNAPKKAEELSDNERKELTQLFDE